MIPGEWFGWMHHKTDIPPTVVSGTKSCLLSGPGSNPAWARAGRSDMPSDFVGIIAAGILKM